MVFISLLPQGLIQTWASFTQDYVSARSPEMIHSPVMQALVWLRVPGDLVFSVGAVAFAVFLFQALRTSDRPAVAPVDRGDERMTPAAAE
jgi:nitric oxide reductase subunit B